MQFNHDEPMYLGDTPLVVASEVPGVGAGFDRRLRAGVGVAAPPVPGELLAVGAAALRPDAEGGGVVGHGEAELLTASVVGVTRVAGSNLLGGHAEDLDAVQPVGLLHLLHDHLVAPRGLVHLDDGVQPPVSDEQEVFEDDQREGVTDQTGGDCLHIFTLQVSVLETNKNN